MADNLYVDEPGSGRSGTAQVRHDDVNGVKVLMVKLAGGGDGVATEAPFDASLGFSVNQAKLDTTNDEVAIGSSAAQTGGLDKFRLLSAASSNATNIKSTAGRLYGVHAANTNAAVRYLKIYDKATAPDQNDTPFMTIPLPASGQHAFNGSWPSGIKLANGLGIRLVTGLADSDNTSVGTDILVHIFYK
jgi:hypothetical protein